MLATTADLLDRLPRVSMALPYQGSTSGSVVADVVQGTRHPWTGNWRPPPQWPLLLALPHVIRLPSAADAVAQERHDSPVLANFVESARSVISEV